MKVSDKISAHLLIFTAKMLHLQCCLSTVRYQNYFFSVCYIDLVYINYRSFRSNGQSSHVHSNKNLFHFMGDSSCYIGVLSLYYYPVEDTRKLNRICFCNMEKYFQVNFVVNWYPYD